MGEGVGVVEGDVEVVDIVVYDFGDVVYVCCYVWVGEGYGFEYV